MIDIDHIAAELATLRAVVQAAVSYRDNVTDRGREAAKLIRAVDAWRWPRCASPCLNPEHPYCSQRVPLAAAMFDAIETGRQWETIARRLADDVEACWPGVLPLRIRDALAAFRDVADRTPGPHHDST